MSRNLITLTLIIEVPVKVTVEFENDEYEVHSVALKVNRKALIDLVEDQRVTEIDEAVSDEIERIREESDEGEE